MTTDWPIDILPLIDRLAQEKPIADGLSIDLLNTTNWPGEWQVIQLHELESFAFSKRYDLAVISLKNDSVENHYEGKSVLNKPNSTIQSTNDGNLSIQTGPGSIVPMESLMHGITRLRDLLARRVLVLAHPCYTPLLRSLGFSQIEHIDEPDIIIWQFNILSYKQVPDWLNSKYWANPENWGKYRW